jgi:hypothetical protein
MQHVNSVKPRLRLRSDSNLSPSMPRILGIDLTSLASRSPRLQ